MSSSHLSSPRKYLFEPEGSQEHLALDAHATPPKSRTISNQTTMSTQQDSRTFIDLGQRMAALDQQISDFEKEQVQSQEQLRQIKLQLEQIRQTYQQPPPQSRMSQIPRPTDRNSVQAAAPVVTSSRPYQTQPLHPHPHPSLFQTALPYRPAPPKTNNSTQPSLSEPLSYTSPLPTEPTPQPTRTSLSNLPSFITLELEDTSSTARAPTNAPHNDTAAAPPHHNTPRGYTAGEYISVPSNLQDASSRDAKKTSSSLIEKVHRAGSKIWRRRVLRG